jgi:hypothetical protein
VNDLSQLNSEENWEYLIQPGEYEEIKLINSNLIAVKDESGNYGIINRKKDSITNFEYFNVWGDEESILVMDYNKKFSILDCEGNLISKETYDGAELFCEDLAAVRKDDKWGFIDREGNLAIDYQYDNIYGGFSDGLMAVEKEGMWRFIDTDGEWVFGMDFENAHSFSEGLAAVLQNGVWGYIDLDGEMVIEGQYYEAGDFGEGMAAVCKEIDGVRQWGYIDKDGNICIDFQLYDAAEGRIFIMGEFHDGYAIITDTFYCLIDKNGQGVLGKDGCFLTGGFDYSEEVGGIPAYDYADENMMIRKYGLVDINEGHKYNAYHLDYDSEAWENAKLLAAILYSQVGEANADDVDEEKVREAIRTSQDIYGNNIENTIGNCNSFYGDGKEKHFYEQ